MKRECKPIGCITDELDVTGFGSDLIGWFERQSNVGELAWFLAHADDGVIWGQMRQGRLVISSDVFDEVSPPLRTLTLQQARLFGERAEVRVWRDGSGFQARRLQDRPDENAEAFDEEHILWGTKVEDCKDNFTLLADGRQGLRHAVPIEVPGHAFDREGTGKLNRPIRLKQRHYLGCDEGGRTRIILSRLVGLRQQPVGGQNESETH